MKEKKNQQLKLSTIIEYSTIPFRFFTTRKRTVYASKQTLTTVFYVINHYSEKTAGAQIIGKDTLPLPASSTVSKCTVEKNQNTA